MPSHLFEDLPSSSTDMKDASRLLQTFSLYAVASVTQMKYASTDTTVLEILERHNLYNVQNFSTGFSHRNGGCFRACRSRDRKVFHQDGIVRQG
jgi:hypothetical protein